MLTVIGAKGANGKRVFIFWTTDSLLNLGYFCSRTVSSPYTVRKPLITLWIKLSVFNSNILYSINFTYANINFNFLKGEAPQLTLFKLCVYCTDIQVSILVMSWFVNSHLHWDMSISQLCTLAHYFWDIYRNTKTFLV